MKSNDNLAESDDCLLLFLKLELSYTGEGAKVSIIELLESELRSAFEV